MQLSDLARHRAVPVALALALAWAAGQPLKADDKPGFWSSVQSILPGKAAKAVKGAKGAKGGTASPADKSKGVLKEMVGTWVGQQDGMPDAQFTLVLRKDATFEFTTRVAGASAKKLPKGVSSNMGSQKGTYTFDGDTLNMDDKGEAGMNKSWKMVDKVLVLDGNMRLKRTR
jgi:hypothetical protein